MPALRKRQQIDKASRTMFMWVALAAGLLGLMLVSTVFLFQKGMFNQRVIGAKATTLKVLENNNSKIEELQNNVRALNTNESLRSVMISGQTDSIQVILDALPSTVNSSAFGASLQDKLLQDKALQIESLRVDPVVGVESTSKTGIADDTFGAGGDNTINFKLIVGTSANNPTPLKELLLRFEKSIRPINVLSATIERQRQVVTLTIYGQTYYEPARSINLTEKTIK